MATSRCQPEVGVNQMQTCIWLNLRDPDKEDLKGDEPALLRRIQIKSNQGTHNKSILKFAATGRRIGLSTSKVLPGRPCPPPKVMATFYMF